MTHKTVDGNPSIRPGPKPSSHAISHVPERPSFRNWKAGRSDVFQDRSPGKTHKDSPPDFKITLNRNEGCFMLSLAGTFDERSAYLLIENLREACHDAKVVFIMAKGLKDLSPSGCETFRRNLHVLNDLCYRLVFADESAAHMAPGGIEYF